MTRRNVTIPIAGHAYVEVEANNEKAAIEAALEKATLRDVEDWEPLERFNKGNICYCPQPWDAKVQEQ